MKIENTEVYGFQSAIRAMRNPMDSWNKSDSGTFDISPHEISDKNINYEHFYLGDNDIKLSQKLTKAGTEHRKHLRMIQVWADFTLPRYIHSELDTYKYINKISCSTMHKITSRLLTKDDFDFIFTKEIPTQVYQKFIFYSEDQREWKNINGFENYLISNDGKIKSLKTNKERKMLADNRGYSKITLCKNGKTYQFPVHRLVLAAFNQIDNFEDMEVNHKNGNKLDNRIENLEWVTSSENQNHAYTTKLQMPTQISKKNMSFGIGQFTEKDIINIKQMYQNGCSQRSIAKIYNTYHSSISNIINNNSYNIEIDVEDILIDLIIKINKLINLHNIYKTSEKKNEILLQINYYYLKVFTKTYY